MARYEFTDFEWKAIKPHLPDKPRGAFHVSTTGGFSTALGAALGRALE